MKGKAKKKIFPWLVAHKNYEAIMPDAVEAMRKKYVEVRKRVVDENVVAEEDILEPGMPDYRDLLLAHEREYIEDFMYLRHTSRTMFAGLPLEPIVKNIFLKVVGGTSLCTELAVRNGICAYIGGGLIHAFSDHAEGFCFLNDIGVALLRLKALGLIKRGAAISCDAHQADGVANVLRSDPDIFTLSIFQEVGYPFRKEKSDWDIVVSADTTDEDYLRLVESAVRHVLESHRPEVVVYISSADPYKEDDSSVLQISMDALKRRDEIVIGHARSRGVPVAVLVSASGTTNVPAAVRIHLNTLQVVKKYVYKDDAVKRAS